jgi:hypothetical protein
MLFNLSNAICQVPKRLIENLKISRNGCPCPEKSSLGGGLERCKSDLVAKALELSEAAAL